MEFSTELIGKVVDLLQPGIRAWSDAHPEAGALETENALRKAMQGLGAACLEGVLAREEEPYPQAAVPCPCGGQARYLFRRWAKTLSVFGWVRYRRAYYVCPRCHRGQHPLDQRRGLRPGQMSVALASLLALEGIEVSFEQAQRKVAKTLLLEVSENTVRQATQEFGALQEAEEKRWIEESHEGYDLLARRRESSAPPPRLYGSLDGVHVPVGGEWPELKCLCWYRTEERAWGRGVGETGSLRATEISYHCDLSDALDFRDLVWASGCQRGADRAAEVVFVADGAVWIWNIVSYHFPQAIQIVDWYHAVQYLHAITQAAYAVDDPEGSRWLERAREQLWEGEIDAVIASCGEHTDHPAAATAVHKAITYFTNNQRRMDYRRFREQGYLIGSGTVESACKQIGTMRLKRSGARWAKQGARYTAKARAAWLSDSWQTLESRAQQLAQAA